MEQTRQQVITRIDSSAKRKNGGRPMPTAAFNAVMAVPLSSGNVPA